MKLKKQTYEVQKRTKPVVEIVWLDHCGGSKWQNYDPNHDGKLIVCHSVGYLIDETNDTYVLTGDFGQPPGLPYGRMIVIGKHLVISKKVISKRKTR